MNKEFEQEKLIKTFEYINTMTTSVPIDHEEYHPSELDIRSSLNAIHEEIYEYTRVPDEVITADNCKAINETSGTSSLKDGLSRKMISFMMLIDDAKDIVTTVVITVLVWLLVANFVFKPVQVSGNSMYPTVEDGARGFSSIITKTLGNIDRFDIVI